MQKNPTVVKELSIEYEESKHPNEEEENDYQEQQQ